MTQGSRSQSALLRVVDLNSPSQMPSGCTHNGYSRRAGGDFQSGCAQRYPVGLRTELHINIFPHSSICSHCPLLENSPYLFVIDRVWGLGGAVRGGPILADRKHEYQISTETVVHPPETTRRNDWPGSPILFNNKVRTIFCYEIVTRVSQ